MKKILIIVCVLFVPLIIYGQDRQVSKRDIEIQKTTPLLNLNGLGAVLQFYNGDVSVTHSSNQISITGGMLRTEKLKIGNSTLEIDSAVIVNGNITFYTGGLSLTSHINDADFVDVDDVPIIPIISSGVADTTGITPAKVGNIYINTSAGVVYISTTALRGGWRRMN